MPAESELLLVLAPDRYVLRACREFRIPHVVIYGARHRDLAFQEIPAPAIPVFCEDHHKPEAILTALHRAGFADRRFTAVQTTIEPLLITASVLGRALGATHGITRRERQHVEIVALDLAGETDRARALGAAHLKEFRDPLIDHLIAPSRPA